MALGDFTEQEDFFIQTELGEINQRPFLDSPFNTRLQILFSVDLDVTLIFAQFANAKKRFSRCDYLQSESNEAWYDNIYMRLSNLLT